MKVILIALLGLLAFAKADYSCALNGGSYSVPGPNCCYAMQWYWPTSNQATVSAISVAACNNDEGVNAYGQNCKSFMNLYYAYVLGPLGALAPDSTCPTSAPTAAPTPETQVLCLVDPVLQRSAYVANQDCCDSMQDCQENGEFPYNPHGDTPVLEMCGEAPDENLFGDTCSQTANNYNIWYNTNYQDPLPAHLDPLCVDGPSRRVLRSVTKSEVNEEEFPEAGDQKPLSRDEIDALRHERRERQETRPIRDMSRGKFGTPVEGDPDNMVDMSGWDEL